MNAQEFRKKWRTGGLHVSETEIDQNMMMDAYVNHVMSPGENDLCRLCDKGFPGHASDLSGSAVRLPVRGSNGKWAFSHVTCVNDALELAYEAKEIVENGWCRVSELAKFNNWLKRFAEIFKK